MPQTLFLTVALRKQVDTIEQAETLTQTVRDMLSEYPEVTITANVSQSIPPPEEP